MVDRIRAIDDHRFVRRLKVLPAALRRAVEEGLLQVAGF